MKTSHVRRAFSDAAGTYDAASGLQKEIGEELLRVLPADKTFHRALDVGMGTGWLTEKLLERRPRPVVAGLDLAFGMVRAGRERCRHARLVQADATHLPFRDEAFDLAASNLAYQWVSDRGAAFRSLGRVLSPGGTCALTLFTSGTLPELYAALRATSAGVFPHGADHAQNDTAAPRPSLPTVAAVSAALEEAGFTVVSCDVLRKQKQFRDCFELLRWLKEIGANAMNRDRYVGRAWLDALNEYYNHHFKENGGVAASFEACLFVAEKREYL
jgi:malonyl-CoA O-methyltransferase